MEAVVEEVVEAETDAVVAVVAETLEIAIIGSRKAMVEVVAVAGVVEDMVEEVAMVRAADTEVSFSKFELSLLLYITSITQCTLSLCLGGGYGGGGGGYGGGGNFGDGAW